jgi:hypothetical protein
MPAPLASSPYRFLFLMLLGALPCLLFAAYTQHGWEDWYITFRAAKNLATGHGLVFQQGQVLQTFTSPLNVMVPAGLSWLTGNQNDALVLWLYRFICAGLLGGTVILLDLIARSQNLSRTATCFLIAFFLVDAKTIDFSINGQEAAFLMFFQALQVLALLQRRSLLLGVAWGGLMWSRPDSFIYVGGVTGGYLLHLLLSERASLPATLRRMGIAALVGGLIYAPWLIGTTLYYGSPVPHTIIAKGLHVQTALQTRLLGVFLLPFKGLLGLGGSSYSGVFMPTYFIFGGWPEALQVLARLLAWLAAIAWLLPRMPALVRATSLGAFAGIYYLSYFPNFPYPWYFPSCAFLCVLSLAGLLDQALRHAGTRLHERGLQLAAAAIVSVWLVVSLSMAQEMRQQQALIENGIRKPIGLWLKSHAAGPHDTVFLECLGYIGFYSNLKMYDYPGMSSPEVVAARRRYGENWVALIGALTPDWLVLRRDELSTLEQVAPNLWHVYRQEADFNQAAAIAAVPFLPGRPYLEYDQEFLILHRIASGPH